MKLANLKYFIGGLLLPILLSEVKAGNVTWTGAAGDNLWLTGSNWSSLSAPGTSGTSDTVILNSVSSNQNITYNPVVGGTISSLTINQSSAATNQLTISGTIKISSTTTLGTSVTGAIAKISLVPTAAIQKITLPVTLNSGGVLSLGVYNPSGGATVYSSSITGLVTNQGGLIQLAELNKLGTATESRFDIDSLTMTSGTMAFGNTTGIVNLFSTNSTISGGTITTTGNKDIRVTLSGAINSWEPASVTNGFTGFYFSLNRLGDQEFRTSLKTTSLTQIKQSGVKTVSVTGAGSLSELQFDTQSGSTTTTLKLGSNLSGFVTNVARAYTSNYGVDVGAYTFTNTQSFTPLAGASGTAATYWTLAGNGGTFKAPTFTFNTANANTNVGAGLTLEATGANGTANVLSGVGTIDSTSVFKYSGTASAASPATLTSNRAIGSVEVASGALRLSSLNGVQELRVTGGTADLNNSSQTFTNVSLNGGAITSGTASTSGTFALQSGTVSAVLAGNGVLTKSGANTVTLSGSNSFAGATTISAGTLSISFTNGLAGTSGVGISGNGALAYTGAAANFGKNITVTTGTGTVSNTGGGTLTLSGTLTKGGSVLRLTGGAFDVAGQIVGSSANSDLLVDAATVTLSSSNSYNGPTYIINSGTLTANAASALPTANGRTNIYMDQTGSGGSTLSLGASQSIASLVGAASSKVALGGNTLTVGAASGTAAFAGAISGEGGSLVKDGASTQVISGSMNHSGTTAVSAGKLVVSGSLAGTTGVSVAASSELNVNGLINVSATTSVNGTLSGSGTTGAIVLNSTGVLSPGTNGPGIISVASLSGTAGASLSIEIGKTTAGSPAVAGTDYDQVKAAGSVALNNMTLALNSTLQTNVEGGDLFFIILNGSNTPLGTFNGIAEGSTVADSNGQQYTISYHALFGTTTADNFASYNQGQDVALLAIPEPQTWMMLLSGFGILLGIQRMRRHSNGA